MTSTVLVADDNPDALDLMTLVLQTLGCEVLAAKDGQEAVQLVEERLPDIAFLDLSMPTMDGFQAIAALRKRFADSIPVYALSAHCGQQELKKKALDMGADECLCKPVDLDLIEAKLRQHSLL